MTFKSWKMYSLEGVQYVSCIPNLLHPCSLQIYGIFSPVYNSGIGCTDGFILSCPDFYSGSHSVPGSTTLQEVTTIVLSNKNMAFDENSLHLQALGWKQN